MVYFSFYLLLLYYLYFMCDDTISQWDLEWLHIPSSLQNRITILMSMWIKFQCEIKNSTFFTSTRNPTSAKDGADVSEYPLNIQIFPHPWAISRITKWLLFFFFCPFLRLRSDYQFYYRNNITGWYSDIDFIFQGDIRLTMFCFINFILTGPDSI